MKKLNANVVDNKVKYRNEWKFVCTETDIEILRQKLANILLLDSNTKNSFSYRIRSLYFDDITNNCMYEKEAGFNIRHKWRIRYYDNDTSLIKLERKGKIYDRCSKDSCKITLNQYNDILNENYMDIFWQTDDDLLKKFCIECKLKNLKPKIIVDYHRSAYIEPITNIRVTFDINISASHEIKNFIFGSYSSIQILENNYHVLEIKFDDVLPSYLKAILNSVVLEQTMFSKYYLAREYIERI